MEHVSYTIEDRHLTLFSEERIVFMQRRQPKEKQSRELGIHATLLTMVTIALVMYQVLVPREEYLLNPIFLMLLTAILLTGAVGTLGLHILSTSRHVELTGRAGWFRIEFSGKLGFCRMTGPYAENGHPIKDVEQTEQAIPWSNIILEAGQEKDINEDVTRANYHLGLRIKQASDIDIKGEFDLLSDLIVEAGDHSRLYPTRLKALRAWFPDHPGVSS